MRTELLTRVSFIGGGFRESNRRRAQELAPLRPGFVRVQEQITETIAARGFHVEAVFRDLETPCPKEF